MATNRAARQASAHTASMRLAVTGMETAASAKANATLPPALRTSAAPMERAAEPPLHLRRGPLVIRREHGPELRPRGLDAALDGAQVSRRASEASPSDPLRHLFKRGGNGQGQPQRAQRR